MKYFIKRTEGRLVLCSRDVQVGDTFELDRENNPETGVYTLVNEGDATYQYKGVPYTNHIWNLSRRYNTRKLVEENWYKAIGEVSKDAVWVEEGMEFNYKDTGLGILGGWQGSIPDGNCTVKFRCPTCKTYH